jgi:hypothetical protein
MEPLEPILALTDGVQKTAHLAAWVQSLFEPGQEPVLVGGAAVELLTRGAYTTGDLDFVGNVPPDVERVLVENGFRRRGRHWIHDRGQTFVEFPASALQPGELAVRLRVADREVLSISPEDLLAERLGAWQHWKSGVDGANALLLYRALAGDLDNARLQERCEAHRAGRALAALRAFVKHLKGKTPGAHEIEDWAQAPP